MLPFELLRDNKVLYASLNPFTSSLGLEHCIANTIPFRLSCMVRSSGVLYVNKVDVNIRLNISKLLKNLNTLESRIDVATGINDKCSPLSKKIHVFFSILCVNLGIVVII